MPIWQHTPEYATRIWTGTHQNLDGDSYYQTADSDRPVKVSQWDAKRIFYFDTGMNVAYKLIKKSKKAETELGEFKTTVVQVNYCRVWLTEKVPFGWAKLKEIPPSDIMFLTSEIEVTNRGDDAVSELDETKSR